LSLKPFADSAGQTPAARSEQEGRSDDLTLQGAAALTRTPRRKTSSVGGGAGDRPGQELALRAGGDRHVRPSPIRAVQACLIGLDLKRVAVVTMVVDAAVPAVVMYGGDPFLLCGDASNEVLTYVEAHAYRADAMVVEVAR
jgi:hypothetical protein